MFWNSFIVFATNCQFNKPPVAGAHNELKGIVMLFFL